MHNTEVNLASTITPVTHRRTSQDVRKMFLAPTTACAITPKRLHAAEATRMRSRLTWGELRKPDAGAQCLVLQVLGATTSQLEKWLVSQSKNKLCETAHA